MLSNNKQTAKLAILLALFVTLTGCAATEDSGSGSGSSLPVLKVSVSGLLQGKNVVLSSGQSTANNVLQKKSTRNYHRWNLFFGSFAGRHFVQYHRSSATSQSNLYGDRRRRNTHCEYNSGGYMQFFSIIYHFRYCCRNAFRVKCNTAEQFRR